MADQDSILGTSGKEAIPFEYQIEEQKIARQRALAQAMMMQGMRGQGAPVMFGRHMANPGIGGALLQGLQTYMGTKGMGEADEAQAGMMGRMQAAQSADLGRFSSLQGSDPKAAIAAALSSRFGRVQGMGAQLQKDEVSRAKDQLSLTEKIGGALAQADPEAGARFMQGGTPSGTIPRLSALPMQEGPDAAGNWRTVTTDRTGKQTVNYAPKPMSVSQSLGGHTDIELDKAALEPLSKAKAELATLPDTLANLARVNELIDKGSAQGGGSTPILAVQKFGQLFGINVPQTGMNEEVRMRLGDNILANARKLAPVTENDVALLQQLLGSIDTDPRAMKEILSMMGAKALMTMDRHNAAVEQARSVSSGNPAKYNPFIVQKPQANMKSGALLGRMYQIMKESGHPMQDYAYDGKPVSDIDLNFSFQSPPGASPAQGGVPAGLKRR